MYLNGSISEELSVEWKPFIEPFFVAIEPQWLKMQISSLKLAS